MKAFLIATLLGFSVNSMAANVVFDCKSQLGDNKIAITVSADAGKYTATLEGTGTEGNVEAVAFKKLTPAQIKDNAGVKEIIEALKLSASDLQKIKSIEYYSVGDLQDDGAGVVGIRLKSTLGKNLGQGMFFGWAGPLKCD